MATQLQDMQFTTLVMTGTTNSDYGVDYTLSTGDTIQFVVTDGTPASIHATSLSSSYWFFDGGISSYATILGNPAEEGLAYVMYENNPTQLSFKTQADLGAGDLILCLGASG